MSFRSRVSNRIEEGDCPAWAGLPGFPPAGYISVKTQEGSVWLHGLAVVTAGATFLLIIAGALVVGNEAGLSVPDWPLSYGTWMPPMEGGIFYEHGHRMVATFAGLLTTVLAAGLWWKEPRRWVRRVGLAALLAVLVQGLLGGITVLYLLPTPVSVGHACLAQIFFCLTLSLALFTSPGWGSPTEPLRDDRVPAFRHLAAATTVAVFLQLLLGAALRHKALGLTPHLVGAGVVSFFVGWLVVRVRTSFESRNALRRLGWAIGALLVVQLGLGIASYFIRVATQGAVQPQISVVLITTAHVAAGALLLGGVWSLTLLVYRADEAASKAPSFANSPQKTWA